MMKPDTHRSTVEFWKVFGPATVITILGFFVAYQFVDPAPPRHITIATGSPNGAYYAYGMAYRSILQKYGISLEVKKTAGSFENLQLLEENPGGVDVAFVQGGVQGTGDPDKLISLGSLYYEPLWVFFKKNLDLDQLPDLRGKAVAVGPEGSGTRVLALQLLNLNGITEENTQILTLGGKAASDKLIRGDLDAAFFVTAHHSPVIQQLLRSPEIKLMSFQRADAYTAHFHYLSPVKLPRGGLDFADDIPSEDVKLLAPTTQLVAKADIHAALIDLLLQTAAEVHHKGGLFEKTGEFPSPKYLEFRLSKDTERFYKSGPSFLRRYLPFWVATFIGRTIVLLVPLLALLFPLFRIMPPIYRWRFRSKIYRWYRKIAEVDPEKQKIDEPAKLQDYLQQLNQIEEQVCKTSVPLAFTNELYHLRMHIGMLRDKLLSTRPDAPE